MIILFMYCSVILLLQCAVGLLRWLLMKQDGKVKRIISHVLSGLVLVLMVVSRIPTVEDRISMFFVMHLPVPLGFLNAMYLTDFFVLTAILRMLIEHSLLHLTYTKWEWVLSALIGLIALVFTLQFWI